MKDVRIFMFISNRVDIVGLKDQANWVALKIQLIQVDYNYSNK